MGSDPTDLFGSLDFPKNLRWAGLSDHPSPPPSVHVNPPQQTQLRMSCLSSKRQVCHGGLHSMAPAGASVAQALQGTPQGTALVFCRLGYLGTALGGCLPTADRSLPTAGGHTLTTDGAPPDRRWFAADRRRFMVRAPVGGCRQLSPGNSVMTRQSLCAALLGIVIFLSLFEPT